MSDDERVHQVNVRLSRAELQLLDAEVDRRKEAEPQATVARGEVARILMFRSLNERRHEKRRA